LKEKILHNNLFYQFLAYSLFLFLFVLPIPSTQSIRYISFSILLLSSIYIFYKNKFYNNSIFSEKEFLTIKYIYIILTIWLIIGYIFVSDFSSNVLKELKGQWGLPLLSFLLGYIIMINLKNINNKYFNLKQILLIVFIALFLHIVYLDLFELHYYLDTKNIITRISGLLASPDRANMLTNLLLALLVTEIIYRIRTNKDFLPISNFLLGFFTFLTILSSAFEGMRNGVVAILFMSTTAIFFTFYKNKIITLKLKVSIAIFLIGLLGIPFSYNIKHDKRWESLIETVPIALDTKNNKYWFDSDKYSLPKLSNGEDVNESNYDRIAWFKAGLMLSFEKPFGIGYQRNSFGKALFLKYGPHHANSHAHSSFIEWLLAMGYIGVILWIVLIIYITILCFRYFKRYNSYFSIFLFYVIMGTMARAVVDTNMRDHMFLTFMFFVGFSLVGMFYEKKEFEANSSK
jgi:hypothetical protein